MHFLHHSEISYCKICNSTLQCISFLPQHILTKGPLGPGIPAGPASPAGAVGDVTAPALMGPAGPGPLPSPPVSI